MKSESKIIILICLTALVCINCSSTPVTLKSGDRCPNMTDIDFFKGRTISGTAAGFQLFMVFPIRINSRQDRAWRALLAQAGGDYITDVKIEEKWTWAFVGTVYSTTIEATAYPCKS